jgi:hypothetical protein
MIYKIVSKHHSHSKQDQHHRYKSWEHCFGYFSTNYKQLDEKAAFDQGCLQLAFYLASWGMMRGGSFLLQKDYLIHKYFLKDIAANPKYHKYFDHEQQQRMDHTNIIGIDSLIKETVNSYVN